MPRANDRAGARDGGTYDATPDITAYRADPVPPLGVPLIADLCFWGGVYGAVFGLLLPRFTQSF